MTAGLLSVKYSASVAWDHFREMIILLQAKTMALMAEKEKTEIFKREVRHVTMVTQSRFVIQVFAIINLIMGWALHLNFR